jgi:hypothetical protein
MVELSENLNRPSFDFSKELSPPLPEHEGRTVRGTLLRSFIVETNCVKKVRRVSTNGKLLAYGCAMGEEPMS